MLTRKQRRAKHKMQELSALASPIKIAGGQHKTYRCSCGVTIMSRDPIKKVLSDHKEQIAKQIEQEQENAE